MEAVKDFAAQLTKPRRVPFSLKAQAVLFVVAAAFAPLVLLLAVSSKFFQYGPKSAVPFEYWALLTVAWVLASALLMAHILAKGLTEQIEPLENLVNQMARNAKSSPASAADAAQTPFKGNELENLATQFSRLESALADGRSAALGRIAELEALNAKLASSADLNAGFLSAVSHEIRTPLSAIVSAARIIQHYHEKKPEVVGRFGETIATEGKRLVRLVSDLIDLSKMEAKALDWTEEVVRPVDIATTALRRLEPLFTEHRVKLICDVSEALPRLRCDPKRLTQVLECLLENAVKFSPEDGEVELIGSERDGVLRVTVRDRGARLAAQDGERIFEKSFAATLRQSKEWGRHSATLLGLPLCREIIRHHGGRIWATNGPDHGAAFSFELPLPEHAAALLGVDDSAGKERALRVLLVMQNDVLSEAAARALRLDDIDGRVCSHFQEVLAMTRSWVPDVLVVSSNCLWQLTEGIEARLRKAGVANILMFSPYEGMVDLSAPTHCGPLLSRLGDLVPRGGDLLLVEDDEDYAAVIEFELTQAGYNVARANNGVDALVAVEKGAPAALVLDLVLPRLDGFGVLEALAAKNVGLPTIVLTSLDDDRMDDRLLRLGAVGVYRKYELIQPQRADEAQRVRKVLIPVLGEAPEKPVLSSALRARA
jgi:signal transduction histidine kinase/DNA-binding response OmpR family regulator